MSQIALPLPPVEPLRTANARIAIGNANAPVIDAFARAASWPFGTAVLAGPPRSGKSLLARWFERTGAGQAIDDARSLPEADLFHRWNRAQEDRVALLIVGGEPGTWRAGLPDLASRLGAALHLTIGEPDDAMLAMLLSRHAEARGFFLDAALIAYLAPRCERSHRAAETLIAVIDRLSLERLQPPTLAICRDALLEFGVHDGDTDDQMCLL